MTAIFALTEQVQVALITIIGGTLGLAITSLPALIIALGNRRHLVEAKEVASNAATKADTAAIMADNIAQTIGEPNGNNSLTAMLERIMEAQALTLQWQHSHGEDDMEQLKLLKLRLAALEQLLDARTPLFNQLQDEFEELSTYMHTRNHDILNALTGIKGKVDLLWSESSYAHLDSMREKDLPKIIQDDESVED